MIGVGVVGAGNISDEYLRNLTSFPSLDVRFVADLNVDVARAQAEKYGVGAWGTYEQLLADEQVDIVVNLTIPAVHVEVALQAVQAGKHVWSEKPYGLDLESAAELRRAADEAGLRVAVAPDTILGAGLQTAFREITSGAIGEPQTAVVMFQTPGPESWHPSPEFLFAYGGGPLFDIGPYYLTTLIQIFGAVTSVAAISSKSRETRVIGSGPKAGQSFPVEVPTHVSALYRFESGASAQVTFSFDCGLERQGFVEITGTEGTAVLPDPNRFDGSTTIHKPGTEERTVPAVGASSTRGTGVAELAAAIQEGRVERVPGELAFHVLEVMVATARAAEEGRFITVDSTVERPPLLETAWDPTSAEA